jgi:hypothetical protein
VASSYDDGRAGRSLQRRVDTGTFDDPFTSAKKIASRCGIAPLQGASLLE